MLSRLGDDIKFYSKGMTDIMSSSNDLEQARCLFVQALEYAEINKDKV